MVHGDVVGEGHHQLIDYLVGADGSGSEPQLAAGGEEIERWDAYRQPTGLHYRPNAGNAEYQAAEDRTMRAVVVVRDAVTLGSQSKDHHPAGIAVDASGAAAFGVLTGGHRPGWVRRPGKCRSIHSRETDSAVTYRRSPRHATLHRGSG